MSFYTAEPVPSVHMTINESLLPASEVFCVSTMPLCKSWRDIPSHDEFYAYWNLWWELKIVSINLWVISGHSFSRHSHLIDSPVFLVSLYNPFKCLQTNSSTSMKHRLFPNGASPFEVSVVWNGIWQTVINDMTGFEMILRIARKCHVNMNTVDWSASHYDEKFPQSPQLRVALGDVGGQPSNGSEKQQPGTIALRSTDSLNQRSM